VALFDGLEAGDILYFDGSHRVFTNSDVTTLFLDIMPRLKSGVLVHIHDVFWPSDYPPDWNERFYSEQYILGAMLLCPSPPFRVELPNAFISDDPDLYAVAAKFPCFERPDAQTDGWSFWVSMKNTAF
jgi:hypothetical protein